MCKIQSLYYKYVNRKATSRKEILFPWGDKFKKVLKATAVLVDQYDLIIELANQGLILGYFFSALRPEKVKAVKLSRKGRGATWKPIDEIQAGDIQNKKILLLDLDVVTGRTLRRAIRELGKLQPRSIDLLLYHNVSLYTAKRYLKAHYNSKRNYDLPYIAHAFNPNLDISRIQFFPEKIVISYRDNYKKIELSGNELIFFKANWNIPDKIGKTMFVDDFRDGENESLF